jgi:hypothetical protein
MREVLRTLESLECQYIGARCNVPVQYCTTVQNNMCIVSCIPDSPMHMAIGVLFKRKMCSTLKRKANPYGVYKNKNKN